MSEVTTKGFIVELAGNMAGVSGSLTGSATFDFQAALQHLEMLILQLEAQYGIFLGYKKSQFQSAKPDQDSGLPASAAYSVATILAYRAHATLGVDQITYQRLSQQSQECINRLTPIEGYPSKQGNEQLPVGAGNQRHRGFYGPWYYERSEGLEIESDSTLDLGFDLQLEIRGQP